MNLPDKVKILFEKAHVISLGGATEASIWSIFYPISKVDPGWRSIPYGKPLTNQQVTVLNKAMVPCPDWVSGEIYIAGKGLAKGYWKDPEKTNRQFFSHPVTGERLYRTGDVGRYLPDGNIEFIGREDRQVKVNGHRIELGEIERILERHSGVKECVVNVITDVPGGAALAGYVVLTSERAVDTASLSGFLKDTLPDYMVPAYLMVLDAIPLSPNGKIDRKKCPLPGKRDLAFEQPAVAPETEFQRKMCTIIERSLGVDQVSMTDRLLDLGANSVDMVRIHKALTDELHVKVSVLALFEQPTIQDLCDVLEDTKVGRDDAPILQAKIDKRRSANLKRKYLRRRMEADPV